MAKEYTDPGDPKGTILCLCDEHAGELDDAAMMEYGAGARALAPVHDDEGNHAEAWGCEMCAPEDPPTFQLGYGEISPDERGRY